MPAERRLRSLDLAEVATLIDWAAAEGWNPGLDDAEAFHAADPEGFIGAFVDGQLVAGIAAVGYGASFGFIGLYLCAPEARGRGHGKAVWEAGMARLGSRTVGLDGVDAQRENYRSKGFDAAYRTVRFSGPAGALVAAAVAGAEATAGSTVTRRPAAIVPVTDPLLPHILALDARGFPAPRTAFVRHWVRAPRIALACRRDGDVTGFGVLRACRSGWKVGPLFAGDLGDAIDLFGALAAHAGPGDDIHLDVPQTSAGLAAWLRKREFVPGFETTRMYRGTAPRNDASVAQAVTTLELG